MYNVTGFGITKATQLWVCLYGCFQGNLTKVRRLTLNVGGSISWSCPRLHKERGSHVITNMALSLFPIPPRRDEVRASHIFLLPYNELCSFETRPQVNSPSLKILLVTLITRKGTRQGLSKGPYKAAMLQLLLQSWKKWWKPKKKRNNYKHSFGAMTQDNEFLWENLQSWPSNGTANQSQLGGERHQLALSLPCSTVTSSPQVTILFILSKIISTKEGQRQRTDSGSGALYDGLSVSPSLPGSAIKNALYIHRNT